MYTKNDSEYRWFVLLSISKENSLFFIKYVTLLIIMLLNIFKNYFNLWCVTSLLMDTSVIFFLLISIGTLFSNSMPSQQFSFSIVLIVVVTTWESIILSLAACELQSVIHLSVAQIHRQLCTVKVIQWWLMSYGLVCVNVWLM